tara:strand:+ start:5373 stop:5540 length:168 start_codon:yes stop_codon:yes gene_type:complete
MHAEEACASWFAVVICRIIDEISPLVGSPPDPVTSVSRSRGSGGKDIVRGGETAA